MSCQRRAEKLPASERAEDNEVAVAGKRFRAAESVYGFCTVLCRVQEGLAVRYSSAQPSWQPQKKGGLLKNFQMLLETQQMPSPALAICDMGPSDGNSFTRKICELSLLLYPLTLALITGIVVSTLPNNNGACLSICQIYKLSAAARFHSSGSFAKTLTLNPSALSIASIRWWRHRFFCDLCRAESFVVPICALTNPYALFPSLTLSECSAFILVEMDVVYIWLWEAGIAGLRWNWMNKWNWWLWSWQSQLVSGCVTYVQWRWWEWMAEWYPFYVLAWLK